MKEKVYRSFLKTFTWRVLATTDTVIISYFITGSLKMASAIGVIEVFTKIVLYYVHERVWNRISVGKTT